MSSRGSRIKNGYITTSEYITKFITANNVKILVGVGSKHSLPDFSRSSNAVYAKVRDNGSLQEIRFYDAFGWPIIEIAYHPEPKINNGSRDSVVHYHLYNGLDRRNASLLTEELKQKYAKYLKEFNLYDKC